MLLWKRNAAEPVSTTGSIIFYRIAADPFLFGTDIVCSPGSKTASRTKPAPTGCQLTKKKTFPSEKVFFFYSSSSFKTAMKASVGN